MKKFIMRLCTSLFFVGLGFVHFNKVDKELQIFDESKKLFWSHTAIVGFYLLAGISVVMFLYWIWTDKDKN